MKQPTLLSTAPGLAQRNISSTKPLTEPGAITELMQRPTRKGSANSLAQQPADQLFRNWTLGVIEYLRKCPKDRIMNGRVHPLPSNWTCRVQHGYR